MVWRSSSNRPQPGSDAIWRADHEYQTTELLPWHNAANFAVTEAMVDPTPEKVRKAWAITRTLTNVAQPYMPPDKYGKAIEYTNLAAKYMNRGHLTKALKYVDMALRYVTAGLMQNGVIGKRRPNREDLANQALRLLEEAMNKQEGGE